MHMLRVSLNCFDVRPSFHKGRVDSGTFCCTSVRLSATTGANEVSRVNEAVTANPPPQRGRRQAELLTRTEQTFV